jgi:hypothetical protein
MKSESKSAKHPYLVEDRSPGAKDEFRKDDDNASVHAYLAARHAEGWELVAVVGVTHYFKATAN